MLDKLFTFIQKYLFIVPLIFAIKIFLPWFIMPSINAGDWPYYGKGMFDGFTVLAPLWTRQNGIGLGGINPDFPIFGYMYFTIGLFVNIFHISWELTYKIFWFGLPLLLGILGMFYLYKSIKKEATLIEIFLSIFLYLCNTYFLMISGGGQMGIVLAYCFTPFVVASVVQSVSIFEKKKDVLLFWRRSILLGLLLSIQVFFDPRIAFLTVGICLLYSFYNFLFVEKFSFIRLFIYWFIGLLVVFLLHSYWIIPFYLFKLLLVPKGITSSNGFSFFSFADFSHALSFLHPNWPENIFGKVHFLRPEFLVYPLIAFSGLILSNKFPKKTQSFYSFFAVIALLGVFFAKGVNDPFGGVNRWVFSHLPGFNLFRDPTKYYMLIALSYSLMIPMVVDKIMELSAKKRILLLLFMITVLFLLIFPLRDAITGSLDGTFRYTPIPSEYVQLANLLSSKSQFSRILWIPDQSRFRFVSNNHPLTVAGDILQTSSASAIVEKLKNSQEELHLEQLSIQYLIVPDDPTGEIFVTDRKYDNSKRIYLIHHLDAIPYLHKSIIGNIVMYELPNPNGHFYLENGNTVMYKAISSSEYTVSVSLRKQQTLIFAEAFHPGWVAKMNSKTIKSVETKDGLNSFVVPAGNYKLEIVFMPDEYQAYFYLISGTGLLGILGFLFFTRKRRKIIH